MPRASAPASQLAFSELSIRNYGLFANHFLETRLPLMAEWLAESARINAVFAELQTLYQLKGAAMSDATNEAQTENDWIQPVFNALWGQDCYQVQVNLPNSDGRGQPDYALFTSPAARDGAESFKGTLAYWNEVAVVGDAKKWSDSLDKTRKGETPGAQISRYLFQTNKRWGILTNGRLWRLYEQDKARGGGVYYEVDLETILKSGDKDSFKSFYFFFRREAFLPGAVGLSFIEQVFKGSAEYAAQVGEGLKESVYDALRHLMNGFFAHPANALDRHDPAQLQKVHDTALIVLYRLLFILFAEDRGLLPCDDALYNSHSLRARHVEINRKLRLNHTYLPQGNSLWAGVCDLCVLIDGGLEIGGRTVVRAYNGGLFSAAKHPDIAPEEGQNRRWRIGDAALAEVIDRLAYTREKWDKPGRDDIDYSSLEVQNLGSIYEGLLELQPLVALVALIEVREGGKTLWKPQSEVAIPKNIGAQNPRRLEPDEIYLATNKGERKATGSYYTPKYIVDYIVEQTVGPLAHRAAEQVAALKPAFDLEMAELLPRLESGDESARTPTLGAERALLSPYLELRVLDPAMGSGHFLVGAADYLSFAMATDPSLPALLSMGDEEAQAFYKRLAVEHCLYGVDLNPLAVELAKLSLWLHTVSRSRALSFLDHHLHPGNSLIGASLDRDLGHEPPRLVGRTFRTNSEQLVLGLYEALADNALETMLSTFAQIADGAGGDAESERAKDALYRDMDALRDRYRGVANLWLAPFFGVAVSADFYQRAAQTLGAEQSAWQALTSEPIWIAAQEIAAQKRFFHWHLEFPEVFLNPNGLKPEAERGFDAVIGNPPWGADFRELEKAYNKKLFGNIIVRMVDSFMFFVFQAKTLTKDNGLMGQIVPSPLLLQVDMSKIRRFLLENTTLKAIINLGDGIFGPDVTVPSCTYIAQNCLPDLDNNSPILGVSDITQFDVAKKVEAFNNDELKVTMIPQNFYAGVHNYSWITKGFELSLLISKIGSCSEKLEDWIDGKIQRGISADYNAAFIVSEQQIQMENLEREVCSPVLLGESIQRFAVEWKGNSVIYLTRECNIESYPNIREHLSRYRENITCTEVKQDKHPWYSLHRPRERAIFDPLKFVGLTTTDRISLALDENGYMAMDGLYLFRLKREHIESRFYLLALLNSALMTFMYRYLAQEEGRTLPQVKATNLNPLPIRKIEFSTPADERDALLETAKSFYASGLASGDFADLMGFVANHLDAASEKTDVVHDLLAHLAGEMMRLGALKNDERREFFEWLESVLKTPIDGLSNKTRLRDYAGASFDSWLDVLTANRARFDMVPSAREPRKQLLAEWTASVDKLHPLQNAITATDEAIDAIVFALYGLNDDEIALINA